MASVPRAICAFTRQGSDMIFVIDIDGTLADLTHREFLVADKGREDWDKFFSDALIYKDAIIPGALEGYNAIYDIADKLYLVSGRPESSLLATEEWLIENDFNFPKIFGGIILRPDDLHMPSHEFKRLIMDSVIIPENGEDAKYVFIDDEDRNLEMFSEYGLALKAPEIWNDIMGVA